MARARVHVPLAVAAALLMLVALVPPAPARGAGAVRLRVAPPAAAFVVYRDQVSLRRLLGGAVPAWPAPGYVPSPVAPPRADAATRSEVRRSYPASYDLRTDGKVSPVKDQDPFGTCWAFAALASLESGLLPGEERDFSEDNMVLRSGFDTGGDPYDYGGTYPMATAYLVRWSGPVDEADDAYGDGVTPPGLVAAKHVQEVLYVPGGAAAGDTGSLKSALMDYGAVATSMYWDDAGYDATDASYIYTGFASVNHGVTVVGWDDAFARTRFTPAAPADGAWLVKNSWGTEWGESGYFWVSYADRWLGTQDVYNAVYDQALAATDYADLYSYDPLGESALVGYEDDTAWGANVFHASDDQPIVAAGFYTPVPGTSCAVYAGRSLATLAARGSASYPLPGFHTLAFTTPLAVSPGDAFAVAVRVTAPGTDYPLSIEYALPGYSSAAEAAPGQSFTSYDGTEWEDLTLLDSTANLCLEAYSESAAPPPETDSTPPQTTASGADDDWHAEPVTVSFSAVDPGADASGVDYTESRLDDGDWVRSDSRSVSDDGSHELSYRSVDKAGNAEAVRECVVKIDTRGPVCAVEASKARRGGRASIPFRVKDALTPLVRFSGRLLDSRGRVRMTLPWRAWGASGVWHHWTFPVALPRGSYQVRIFGQDQAGNLQRVVGKGVFKVV